MEERHHYRGGLVWPVILVGAGVVFLLNNLGVLGWGVWETLFRLWPVLLIAIGLDILVGRRSILGSGIVALFLIGVLVLAIWIGVPSWNLARNWNWNLGPVDRVDRTETISEDLRGVSRADVTIGFSTGSLSLAALPEGSSQLIAGEVDLSTDERLQLNHGGSGSVGRLDLHSENASGVGIRIPTDERKRWDLELNRDIAISLNVGTGVGASTLDLTQLNLSDLEINSGVGTATVKLPVRGRFEVKIDGGVGELILIIPPGLGARIQVDRGLGGINLDGDFNRRDDEYTTRNYAGAEHRAEINVNGGIGRIVLRQVSE